MDDCFIHGYVHYWMCQLDVSVICLRMCLFFQPQFLALLLLARIDLSLPVGNKFYSQKIVKLSVGYWSWIRSSDDHIYYSTSVWWSWRELNS